MLELGGKLRPRGNVLAAVLMITALMLVVGLALASLSVFNLNLSARWLDSQQAYQLAQAAVAQVASDLQNDPTLLNTTIADPVSSQSLATRYPAGANLLASGASHFPGTVTTWWRPAATRPQFSVDNLGGGVPVDGWRGRNRVPPNTLDLVLQVSVGGRSTLYEAFMRRRWPYALTTCGKVALVGNMMDGKPTPNPSDITGKVLSLSGGSLVPTGDSPGASPTTWLDRIYVPTGLYDQISTQGMHPDSPQVLIGGASVELDVRGTRKDITSGGNRVDGRVDLSDPGSKVVVVPAPSPPPNAHTGGQRILGYGFGQGMLARLVKACDAPAYTNGVDLGAGDTTPIDWGPPLDWQTTLLLGGAPPARGMPPPRFFFIRNGLSLPPPDSKDNTFVIGCNAGNTVLGMGRYSGGKLTMYTSPDDLPQPTPSPGGTPVPTASLPPVKVSLNHCTLEVRGNLDLGSSAQLEGDGASLIVRGSLLLNGGTLNAGNHGMVIWCENLLCNASGHYQGLIVARRSAVFFNYRADPDAPDMTIRGALVAGQDSVSVCRVPINDKNEIGDVTSMTPMHGLLLWGTGISYDPRYLANIDRFGDVELVALDPLP